MNIYFFVLRHIICHDGKHITNMYVLYRDFPMSSLTILSKEVSLNRHHFHYTKTHPPSEWPIGSRVKLKKVLSHNDSRLNASRTIQNLKKDLTLPTSPISVTSSKLSTVILCKLLVKCSTKILTLSWKR